MVFSSLRSRNRHSANPNPRLHTSASRAAPPHRNTAREHAGVHAETQVVEVKPAHRSMNITQTAGEKDASLWRQCDDVNTTRLEVKGQKGLDHGCQRDPPRPADPSPLPQTLRHDADQINAISNLQAPPPHLLPALTASSLGSTSSRAPLFTSDQTKPCQHLLTNQAAPPSVASCTCRSITEGKACTSPLTSQQWRRQSADPTPKKKSRKSSTPVKIERQKPERDVDEEES